MPLLWRYLIYDYLKVLALSTASFVAILLTLRFDEIAHFACLGSSAAEIGRFILFQLPYLLPIALPVSALIASYLLYARLSHKQELTAMRACGIGLLSLLAPVLAAAGLLTVCDFYFASEISSQAHLQNGQLRHTLRTINPLLLVQNKRMLNMQGILCETLGSSRHGEFVSDLFLALPDKAHDRIALVLAKSFSGVERHIEGSGISFITSQPEQEGFDALSVENIASLETPYEAFTPAFQQKTWTLHPDHLQFSLLLSHLEAQRQTGNKKGIAQVYSEISRRLSTALSLFAFTLFGAAFSIQIGRRARKSNILILALGTGFYLVCYFLGKSMDDKWIAASLLFLVPVAALCAAGSLKLFRLSRGIE